MLFSSDNDDFQQDYHSENEDLPTESASAGGAGTSNQYPPNNHNNWSAKEKDSSDDDDNSDVDDPNYLKKLCSSFTNKISEKNETLNKYKRMLINSNLQLVKMQSAYQRQLRTLYLKGPQGVQNQDKLKDNKVKEDYGKDPLTLFPEEVWIMILSQISDIKDLRSLSKTCLLFESILNSTKQQWLFSKVFPYLFNHLRRKDVLRSRLCCKQWSTSIDKFLEEYYLIQTYSSSKFSPLESTEKNLEEPDLNLKSFHFEYCYSIPFPLPEDLESSSASDNEGGSNSSPSVTSSQQSINRNHDKFREDMRLHERNPFIGRSITIEEDGADFEMENVDHQRNFVQHSKLFLEQFGKHIWHLSIGCTMAIQSPQDFYRVIIQSLENCGNLKSLCVSGNLDWRRGGLGGLAIESVGEVRESLNLESVQIDVDDRRVFWFQDKLIKKFSGQLKRLEVTLWQNDVYGGLDWGNLRELQVNKGISVLLLAALGKTRMGNLRKLTICLNGRGPYLRNLVELSRWFGRLNYLEVKLEGRGQDGLLEEMLEEGMMGSRELTTLEVVTGVTEMKDYGWLVAFPWVSRVIIRHGHWTNVNMVDMAQGYLGGRRMEEEVRWRRDDGVLRIARYLEGEEGKMSGKIYGRSRIWELLPFLEELEVWNGRFVPARRKVFTRVGYEWFKRKREEGNLNGDKND